MGGCTSICHNRNLDEEENSARPEGPINDIMKMKNQANNDENIINAKKEKKKKIKVPKNNLYKENESLPVEKNEIKKEDNIEIINTDIKNEKKEEENNTNNDDKSPQNIIEDKENEINNDEQINNNSESNGNENKIKEEHIEKENEEIKENNILEYDFSEEKLNKVEEEDIILEGDQDLKNNQKLINEEREEKEENNNININIDNEEKENEQNDNQILRNMPNKEKKEGFKERINDIDIKSDESKEKEEEKEIIENKEDINKNSAEKEEEIKENTEQNNELKEKMDYEPQEEINEIAREEINNEPNEEINNENNNEIINDEPKEEINEKPIEKINEQEYYDNSNLNEFLEINDSLIKVINITLESKGFNKTDIQSKFEELFQSFTESKLDESHIPIILNKYIELLSATKDSDKKDINIFLQQLFSILSYDKEQILEQILQFAEGIEEQGKLKTRKLNRNIRSYIKDCQINLTEVLKQDDMPSDKIVSFDRFNAIAEECGIKLKKEYLDVLLYQMKMAVPNGRSIYDFNMIVIVDFLK